MNINICDTFWNDVKSEKLSGGEKLLLIYLITCKHVNICGYYDISINYICSDLNWDSEKVKYRIGELCNKDFIFYDFEKEVVLIRDFLKHNPFQNPNQLSSAIESLKLVTANSIEQEFLNIVKANKENMQFGKKEGFHNLYEELIKNISHRICETCQVSNRKGDKYGQEKNACPFFLDR